MILFVDDFGIGKVVGHHRIAVHAMTSIIAAAGDVGAYNSAFNDTPNIDSKLAARGLRFTDLHAMSLCAPSRASLMTGQTPFRSL